MTADTAIRARLLTLTPVTALVSTRITTGRWHQSPSLPAIRVAFIDEPTLMQLRGTIALWRTRIQVDAKASEKVSGLDAKDLANDVMDAVSGDFDGGVATGLTGFAGDAGDLSIASIIALERRENFMADEFKEWIVTQDFFVTHRG